MVKKTVIVEAKTDGAQEEIKKLKKSILIKSPFIKKAPKASPSKSA